jgi:hypothetical protein
MNSNKQFILPLLCCAALPAAAQRHQAPVLSDMSRDKAQVGLTLFFPDGFYTGNNVYVLHIGSYSLDISRQSLWEGTGTMIFDIRAADFDALQDGRHIWLSYGEREDIPENDIQQTCAASSGTAWYLGVLDKKKADKK